MLRLAEGQTVHSQCPSCQPHIIQDNCRHDRGAVPVPCCFHCFFPVLRISAFIPRNIFPGGAWGHLPTAAAPTPAGENTFSVGQHALPTEFSSVRRMRFTRQHWNGGVCIRDKTSVAEALARMMRAAHPVMKKLAWYGRGRGGPVSPRFLGKDAPQVRRPIFSSGLDLQSFWSKKIASFETCRIKRRYRWGSIEKQLHHFVVILFELFNKCL